MHSVEEKNYKAVLVGGALTLRPLGLDLPHEAIPSTNSAKPGCLCIPAQLPFLVHWDDSGAAEAFSNAHPSSNPTWTGHLILLLSFSLAHAKNGNYEILKDSLAPLEWDPSSEQRLTSFCIQIKACTKAWDTFHFPPWQSFCPLEIKVILQGSVLCNFILCWK